jgi:hypothetical protein
VRKLAALALLVGLCLPYACTVRPITGVWHDFPSILFVGMPVIAALIYGLHTLLPLLARFHDRHARTLYAVFRIVYFGLAGGYLAFAVTKRQNWPGPIETAVALVVTGVLFVWQQDRGTRSVRLPLLLLTVVGVPAVAFLVGFLRSGDLQIGGWVLTAGWALAVVAEMQVLSAAPVVAHGG